MSSLRERPALALHMTEAERHARFEKNARLRELRSQASLLVLDPHAAFHDEIDCTAIFEELQGRLSKS